MRSAAQLAKLARGPLKAVWWPTLIFNAATLCLYIRMPAIADVTIWPAIIGVAGLILSVLALRSFSRDERRKEMVKVFE